MKFLILLTDPDPAAWERATEEQLQQVFAQHDQFSAAVAERGSIVSGEALAGVQEARTLRLVDGVRTVTDGPYAETAEQLGGFYLVDVADADVAVELCRLLPEEYVIEVRPAVVEVGM